MSDADTIIARCTRDGVVMWGQVAKQLGVSIDKARRLYEPVSSARADPQQLSEDRQPLSAGMGRGRKCQEGEGLKALILGLLERHGKLSTEDLAFRAQSTPGSVRRRLGDLIHHGLVQNDQARSGFERTWTLTQAGKTIAKTHHTRPGDIGPGAQSAIGKAA